ncbi:magnesium transporter CorA family protein [Dyadobacter sandarakinus]|uniref:Magnesium transporter CorA n=1 Tax=Dyadobacter sandarakinus TaxID=2747268 RepID=A0ABX7I1K2_9BACT|nr:CorA family divalent cation transporter [Dyadobacter sandarakinus]QRQ99649.1 magnesium transporter CorA [Dyadobacter sandarakinus]
MIHTITKEQEHDFEWIDIEAPTKEELKDAGNTYRLHESHIADLQQHDHLPKVEKLDGYVFIIIRSHAEKTGPQADTVTELTDKVAIFMNEHQVITIHKKPWSVPEMIRDNQLENNDCKTAHQLVNEIVKNCLTTFETQSDKLIKDIEYYEENMFLKNRKASLLQGLYYLRRRVEVTRRVIMLTHEIVDKLDAPDRTNAYTRDTRDLYVKLQSIYDTLFENMNQLVMIYFSISSQRTNEIVRVLTLFSVFFMPLTFIVGIYGMNFDYMPELHWKWGYPGVMILMAVITAAVYAWFKKKGWL